MSKSKRCRKIRSANKALKRARRVYQAMSNVQNVAISAACVSQVAMVQAQQFAKGGQEAEVATLAVKAIGDAQESVIVSKKERDELFSKFGDCKTIENINLHVDGDLVDRLKKNIDHLIIPDSVSIASESRDSVNDENG